MINGWNWQPYRALAQTLSLQYGVAPELILAIMGVESAFNPRAYRYEAKLNDASRGLMQLLLSTARDLGYTGTADGLYDAGTNADLGTQYLAYQLQRYGDLSDAISAYNGGHALRLDGGYANQTYVDRVLAAWREFVTALGGDAVPLPDQPGSPPDTATGGTSSAPVLALALGLTGLILWGMVRR